MTGEGMERYIGMPCIFGNTPEYINSFVAELREIKDFGPMAANYCVSWGSLFRHCKPHPISEELVRLRAKLGRYKALLIDMHGSMADEQWAQKIADCLAPIKEDNQHSARTGG